MIQTRLVHMGWEQIEKVARVDVEKELAALGLPAEAIDGILSAMALRSLDQLEGAQPLFVRTPSRPAIRLSIDYHLPGCFFFFENLHRNC